MKKLCSVPIGVNEKSQEFDYERCGLPATYNVYQSDWNLCDGHAECYAKAGYPILKLDTEGKYTG
jgi:hypothetical protein